MSSLLIYMNLRIEYSFLGSVEIVIKVYYTRLGTLHGGN